jgi:hypothetical protein
MILRPRDHNEGHRDDPEERHPTLPLEFLGTLTHLDGVGRISLGPRPQTQETMGHWAFEDEFT